MNRYQRHKEIFNEVLALPSLNFTPSEIEEVNEYVQFNEFGIALMTFRGIVIEEKKPPLCSQCQRLLEELISLMSPKYDKSYIDKIPFI